MESRIGLGAVGTGDMLGNSKAERGPALTHADSDSKSISGVGVDESGCELCERTTVEIS